MIRISVPMSELSRCLAAPSRQAATRPPASIFPEIVTVWTTLTAVGQKSLNARVAAAAGEALARQRFVTPVDVCLGLGWLHASNVDDWRHGRVDHLEYFLPVHGARLTELLVCLHR